MRPKTAEERLLELLHHARRPEPIEQVVEAVDPLKALLSRLRGKLIPLIEQQRNPGQKKALLARLEEDVRAALKVLDELDNRMRETRRSYAELLAIYRSFGQGIEEAVLDALRQRSSAAMGELCQATGYGQARVKRVLKALGDEGRVKRTGTTSGTRYRLTGTGSANEKKVDHGYRR